MTTKNSYFKSELIGLNPEFVEFKMFRGFEGPYAILPFGGAYLQNGREYIFVRGTESITDSDELRAFIYDLQNDYLNSLGVK